MGSGADAGASAAPPCEPLAWDSEHFGVSIARVRGQRLDAERAERVDRWCADEGIDCLYLLADSKDAETARVAARHGYRVVDHRLNLSHDLEGIGAEPWHSPGPLRVRLAEAGDLEALGAIAALSHTQTRFYFDGRFAEDRCGALYVRWVERALEDPGRELLVAELRGQPIGYHALGLPGEAPARADLIALEPARRGHGLGTALLLSSLRRLRDHGADFVVTAMQARNAGPVRSHERAGFVLERTEVWHHKWYGDADGS